MSSPSLSPAYAPVTCIEKVLPQEVWAQAAQKAVQINPANAVSIQNFRAALPGAVIEPEHLALLTAKRWPTSGSRWDFWIIRRPISRRDC